MIVILSFARDLHARAVRRELLRAGQAVEILDVAELGAGAHLTFAEGHRPRAVWRRACGTEVDLAAARAIWHRRLAAPSMPASAEPGQREFAMGQWHTLLLGALQALGARVPVYNAPLADRHLEKPFQLATARRIGLRIPETTITSAPDVARAFVDGLAGAAVHKPLSGSNARALGTRRYDARSAAALAQLGMAPEIFQEAVLGGRELRVTIAGERTFAAAFRTGPHVVDGRTDLGADYRPHELPADVERLLRALMRELGLAYATIDMKLTDAGEYVFLELNPQGQFLYVELLTGLPIAAGVAEMLVGPRRPPSLRGVQRAAGRPRVTRPMPAPELESR